MSSQTAGVTVGTQVLAWIEAESGRIAERSGATPVEPCAVRLAGILQHQQPMLTRDPPDGLHVGGLAVQVHRHDDPSAWRYGTFDGARIQVVGVGQTVDPDRRGPRERNSAGAGDKRVRRRDHLVAWADAPGPERELQGGDPGIER